jgi:very-short-patch-repair endonuclease
LQVLEFKKVCKEAGTLEQIQKAFHGTQMMLQHTVAAYRVDMYMPEYNIAIECDEGGHADYNVAADAERTKTISEWLGCHWVRYNPDADDFCILRVINDIHRLMLARVKSMARLKDTMVSRLTSPNNDRSFTLCRKVRLGLLEWRNCENAEIPVVAAASAMVGCTMEEFSRHVHANWKPGMKWGNFGVTWHLGFVKDLSLFDLQKDSEVSKAFHWQNVVPEWSGSASKRQRLT